MSQVPSPFQPHGSDGISAAIEAAVRWDSSWSLRRRRTKPSPQTGTGAVRVHAPRATCVADAVAAPAYTGSDGIATAVHHAVAWGTSHGVLGGVAGAVAAQVGPPPPQSEGHDIMSSVGCRRCRRRSRNTDRRRRRSSPTVQDMAQFLVSSPGSHMPSPQVPAPPPQSARDRTPTSSPSVAGAVAADNAAASCSRWDRTQRCWSSLRPRRRRWDRSRLDTIRTSHVGRTCHLRR